MEFEIQTPSNPALARSQAHLPMPLTQPGRSSIQPLHRPPAVLYMQPGTISGDGNHPWMFSMQAVHPFNGEAWEPVLSADVLGPATYPSLMGGCLTDSAVVVAETQGRVLVLER